MTQKLSCVYFKYKCVVASKILILFVKLILWLCIQCQRIHVHPCFSTMFRMHLHYLPVKHANWILATFNRERAAYHHQWYFPLNLSIHQTVQSEFQSAPVPGTPEPDRSSPPPKLLANFIPASMQLLQHCIESIQYEPVTPSMTMTTTTTAKPTTTTAAGT